MVFASRWHRRLVLTLAAAAPAAPAIAVAGENDAQIQAARELFVQAEKDEDAGRWSEALDKLRRVAGVRATAGVRYHIALSEEHVGTIAAALGDYAVAEAQARAENAQDVLRLVGGRLRDLSPRVPRLTIHVNPDVPDAQVTLDGAPLARSLLGVSMPLEPGVHRVEASAPARPPTTATITMHERDTTVIEMQIGAPASPTPIPTTTPTPIPTPIPTTTPTPSHASAVAATIATIVLAGGGIASFLVAGGQHSDAVDACSRVTSSAPGACDSQKNGVRTWDWLAAGAWGAAAISGVAAVVLWSHAPSRGSSGSAPAARVVAGPSSLSVRGSF